jgi:hypothetical protein
VQAEPATVTWSAGIRLSFPGHRPAPWSLPVLAGSLAELPSRELRTLFDSLDLTCAYDPVAHTVDLTSTWSVNSATTSASITTSTAGAARAAAARSSA